MSMISLISVYTCYNLIKLSKTNIIVSTVFIFISFYKNKNSDPELYKDPVLKLALIF